MKSSNIIFVRFDVCGRQMSTNAKPHETITQFDLQEWLVTLGLPVDQEDPLSDQLSDGIVLCQLMNRIKPGSVDNVSLVAV